MTLRLGTKTFVERGVPDHMSARKPPLAASSVPTAPGSTEPKSLTWMSEGGSASCGAAGAGCPGSVLGGNGVDRSRRGIRRTGPSCATWTSAAAAEASSSVGATINAATSRPLTRKPSVIENFLHRLRRRRNIPGRQEHDARADKSYKNDEYRESHSVHAIVC